MINQNKKIIGIALLMLILFGACKEEDLKTYEVDSAFEPYVQLFIDEGEKRGQIIDFSDTGLLVEFSDKIVNDASGYCYLGEYHIVIDKTEWNMLAENEKEFLMLHELGHCELDRRHRNDQFNDNLWKSMMRGDPLVGTQQFQPVAYYGKRKDYYLDELFNEQTSTPDWADLIFNYSDVLPEEKELIFEKNNANRIIEQFNSPGANFEIEVEFSGIEAVSFLTSFQWGTGSHYFYVHNFRNFGTYIGVYQNGKEQHIFYDPTDESVSGSEFNKITARQHNGVSQLFFNDRFIFQLDEFPGALNYFQCEAKRGDNTLAESFKIETARLSRLP